MRASFGIFLVVFFVALTYRYRTRPDVILSNIPIGSCTSTNTIIAFDLHDVLFECSWTQRLQTIIQMPHKWEACKLGINPFFLIKLWQEFTKSPVPEAIFKKMVTYYPQAQLFYDPFLKTCNAQTPRQDMFTLIQDLKSRGYQVVICSNIGEETLADLVSKFPQEFKIFDAIFCTCAADNYCAKNNPHFFHNFKNFLTEHALISNNEHTIFFIDDKLKNIEMATAIHLQGIVFSSAKQTQKILNHYLM